ncbi:MAG: glycosyltransferase family 4 protein [Bacillota bacterium]|nr:glycosyltransferase family 4 protein [Bacillota bacterium]
MSRGRVGILTSNYFDPTGQRLPCGGAERYAVQLTQLLLELDYEVEWWQVGGGWKKEMVPGVTIHSVPETEAPYYTLPHLNQVFYEQAVTVDYAIYFVTFLAYPQVLEKSISISHGIFWDYPSFDSLLNTEEDRAEWRRRLWIAFTGPQRVVSVDTATIQWVTATWPGLAHKLEYIPNFVDTALFHPPEQGRDGEVVRVLFPRRITPVRGVNEAVRAAEILTARHPNLEFHLVGRAGSEEIEERIRQWAADRERIFYYWRNADQMPEVYRSADIALIPSKYAEGTSLSCLEAMASGCAVVASYVGGLSDLIIHNYNGLLVRPTVENLVAAVEELLADPAQRRRLGERAREVALTFDLSLWKERWRRVIEAVFR